MRRELRAVDLLDLPRQRGRSFSTVGSSPMKVLVAIAVTIAVFGVGSGLAALPVTGNEPCSTWYGATESEAWTPQAVTNVIPFGTRCEYPSDFRGVREAHVPSTTAYAAWLVVVAASFAFAVSRWAAAAVRGAACALLIAGLFGLLYAYLGEYTAAVFASCVVGAPLVFALDVQARASLEVSLLFCLSLPAIVHATWFVPGFLGVYPAAAACVLTAGALASAALDLPRRSFRARADAT
jgi:hypothetical protein